MTEKLERILPTVQKPARYVGGEYGQTMKDKRSVELRVAFCFPDTYEIGMSNLGMRILYAVMNRMEGVWCERVFAPWGDMEDAMRANGLPLYALESGDPVSEFDLIAFTIGYEMSYTNVLNMLRLSGVPLHAADRTGLEHMVFAGGACVYNPEPLADFIDFFSVGEGEESTPEILELYRRAKREGWSRSEFLRAVAQIEGVSVPPRVECRRHAGLGHPAGWRACARDKAHRAGSGHRALSDGRHRPEYGDRPRPLESRGHARLHPRLPLLPGGLYLPPGAAPLARDAAPSGH